MASTSEIVTAPLPGWLRPFACELTHLGRPRDGGYLVVLGDVMEADALVSMGVNTDWSFEEDVAARKPMVIHAYDGSVSGAKLWKMALRSLARPFPPSRVVDSLSAALRFPGFFATKARHFEEFVASEVLSPSVGMDVILSRLPVGAERLFFKIDIEGSEYGLFDALIALAGRTTGLAIELHDCDENLDRIGRFIQSYPLRLVHNHANNYAGLGKGGVPRVMELTFTSAPVGAVPAILPHLLEQKNSRSRPAIRLAF